VDALTIDGLIERFRLKPSLIKIDVEGHELSVIRGGRDFFASQRPPLLIEVAGNPDDRASAAGELSAELAAHGYKAYTRDGVRVRPRVAGDRAVDYLFMAEDR
jgi:hypothetical protein